MAKMAMAQGETCHGHPAREGVMARMAMAQQATLQRRPVPVMYKK